MLSVKCGRAEFSLDERDEIMYNGACYQIVTRRVGLGWSQSIPVIPKHHAQRLIKNGSLVFDRKEDRLIPIEIYKVSN